MSTETTYFSERVAEFSEGWLDREATERLAELIKAVKVTGKKGSLTVKFDVMPRNSQDGDIVIIKASVADKTPKIAIDPEVFRTYPDGDLEVIPRDGDGLGDDDKSNVTQMRKKG